MLSIDSKFLLDMWSLNEDGKTVYPYKGERGRKKDLFSVNFTNDTNKFQGMTEEQLVQTIFEGRFKGRGTVRMLPLDVKPGADRNAFAPVFYKGKRIKDFG